MPSSASSPSHPLLALPPARHARAQGLRELGQSLWYDNMRRSFLAPGGELHAFIADGTVVGVTSNPSIFQKSITASADYDSDFSLLAQAGATVEETYLKLVGEDIRTTADLLRPIYEATGAVDGFVSIEVSPFLAHDAEGTVNEALALAALLDRPNVMIKVPGTPEGARAIEELTRRGVSVNVTLLFSLSQYRAVAEAYLAGLEARAADGGSLERIASVASFFVSRVDTLIDRWLADSHPDEESRLRGRSAIANARLAWALGQEIFSGRRWEALAARGARPQRLLWASTSTKDPRLPDTLYLDELIGPDTVNTLPPATLHAFLDHGALRPALTEGIEAARAHAARLEQLGISLEDVGAMLQVEGVQAFADAMDVLMAGIADRLSAARARA